MPVVALPPLPYLPNLESLGFAVFGILLAFLHFGDKSDQFELISLCY